MGWTTCYYATDWKTDRKGHMSVDRRRECDRICTWERKETKVGADGHIYPATKDTVLKSAMVGGVYYAAIRREQEGKDPRVWAAIFLTRGKASDGTVWGYKDMCESSMPFYYDCPKGILDLLTPTDDEDANRWREMCRKARKEKAEERRHRHDPLYTPPGVSVEKQSGSWVFTSENYRMNSKYWGIRYRKAHYGSYSKALAAFLSEFGTDEQKKAYAESDLGCTEDGVAASA